MRTILKLSFSDSAAEINTITQFMRRDAGRQDNLLHQAYDYTVIVCSYNEITFQQASGDWNQFF